MKQFAIQPMKPSSYWKLLSRVVSSNVYWRPRSCDLTPIDIFLGLVCVYLVYSYISQVRLNSGKLFVFSLSHKSCIFHWIKLLQNFEICGSSIGANPNKGHASLSTQIQRIVTLLQFYPIPSYWSLSCDALNQIHYPVPHCLLTARPKWLSLQLNR